MQQLRRDRVRFPADLCALRLHPHAVVQKWLRFVKYSRRVQTNNACQRRLYGRRVERPMTGPFMPHPDPQPMRQPGPFSSPPLSWLAHSSSWIVLIVASSRSSSERSSLSCPSSVQLVQASPLALPHRTPPTAFWWRLRSPSWQQQRAAVWALRVPAWLLTLAQNDATGPFPPCQSMPANSEPSSHE